MTQLKRTLKVLQPHPRCSFSLRSEGCVRNQPSRLARPVKSTQQWFVWICPEGWFGPSKFHSDNELSWRWWLVNPETAHLASAQALSLQLGS